MRISCFQLLESKLQCHFHLGMSGVGINFQTYRIKSGISDDEKDEWCLEKCFNEGRAVMVIANNKTSARFCYCYHDVEYKDSSEYKACRITTSDTAGKEHANQYQTYSLILFIY